MEIWCGECAEENLDTNEMKHIRRIMMAALLLLTSVYAWAYDFVVGGIYYNITSSTTPYKVEVTNNGGGNSYSGNVVIPQSVSYGGKTYSVTRIGNETFYGCTDLTSVIIPNSVTSLGVNLFSYCIGLTSIVVASGNAVFDSRNNCNAIIGTASNTLNYGCKTTTIPNSVTSIGWWAFQGCAGLTSVTIPNSVTSIGENAFYGCTGLTSVTIPNSVTSMGGYAFYGCTGLTSVTIGNSVTSIGDGTFEGCTGLTSFTIPNSVTSIGAGAFEGCTGLTSFTIPNSVTSIGAGAFYNTGYYNNESNWEQGVLYIDECLIDAKNNVIVSNYAIKNTTRLIANGAFYHCTGLTSVTIPNLVTSIGENTFYGCTGLTSVTIPNSVTRIGGYAFYGCTGLTSVTIPNSVTRIGGFAFCGCTGLASITIPISVTEIGNSAFKDCTGLTSITVKATTPPSSYISFPSYDIPLFVSCGCKTVYQNDEKWGRFITIIENDFTYEISVLSANESLGVAYITQQPDCTSGNAMVMAEPKNGSVFRNWTINGQVVSTANPYTFAVSHDVEIMANFSGTGVEEESERKVTIAPNPARDRVRIECEGMQQLELCTVEGRSVASHGHLEDVHEVDLSGLAKGIYILRIHLENSLVVTKKLVKE